MISDQDLDFLRSQGYLGVRVLPDGRWACIFPLMFTHAIIAGTSDGVRYGPEDRWCYHNKESALAALDAWDGTGEPQGWHRHPESGRRRDETGKEWISR